MVKYERPSFKQEWWNKVTEFLEENPEVGFEPEDAKQFIKWCTNRKMTEIEEDLEQLRDLADELGTDQTT